MAETRKDPALKEQILEKALELMSDKGVQRTSLSQIAEASGISKGTLYYYYKSKDELILDINKGNMDRLTSSLLTLLEIPPGEERSMESVILEVFKAVGQAEMRGRLHLYLINEAISGNPGLAEKLRESYREWFEILESAFKAILPSITDREAVARGLVASLDGIIIQNILKLNDIKLERIVEREVKGYVS